MSKREVQRRRSLAREITVVLIVKGLALYVIWFAFFSGPSPRHVDVGGVARSLIEPSVQPQETERAARPGTR